MSSGVKHDGPPTAPLDPVKLQKAARTEFSRAARLAARTFPQPGADQTVLNAKGPLVQKLYNRLTETHRKGAYKKAVGAVLNEVLLKELPDLAEKQPNLFDRFTKWTAERGNRLKDAEYEAKLAKQCEAEELRRQERLKQAANIDDAKQQTRAQLAKLQREKVARDADHDSNMADLEVEISFFSAFSFTQTVTPSHHN